MGKTIPILKKRPVTCPRCGHDNMGIAPFDVCLPVMPRADQPEYSDTPGAILAQPLVCKKCHTLVLIDCRLLDIKEPRILVPQ